MAKQPMTYAIAHAAALDAANVHMRKAGRTSWNEEDSDVAYRTFHKLWPCPKDCGCELCDKNV